eukprot:SM000141S00855  [mRNA]  locus=s141:27419:28615:+ [translate_table: standard]
MQQVRQRVAARVLHFATNSTAAAANNAGEGSSVTEDDGGLPSPSAWPLAAALLADDDWAASGLSDVARVLVERWPLDEGSLDNWALRHYGPGGSGGDASRWWQAEAAVEAGLGPEWQELYAFRHGCHPGQPNSVAADDARLVSAVQVVVGPVSGVLHAALLGFAKAQTSKCPVQAFMTAMCMPDQACNDSEEHVLAGWAGAMAETSPTPCLFRQCSTARLLQYQLDLCPDQHDFFGVPTQPKARQMQALLLNRLVSTADPCQKARTCLCGIRSDMCEVSA